jgi:hypothetical protein
MNTDMTERYSALSTEELVNIAYVDWANYEATAVEVAKRELLSRGVTEGTAYEIFLARNRQEGAEAQEEPKALAIRNAAPLSAKGKVIFFIIGMFALPLALAIEVVSPHTLGLNISAFGAVAIAAFWFIKWLKHKGETEWRRQVYMWLAWGFCALLGCLLVALCLMLLRV